MSCFKALKENGFFNSVDFLNTVLSAEQIDNDTLNQILQHKEKTVIEESESKEDKEKIYKEAVKIYHPK